MSSIPRMQAGWHDGQGKATASQAIIVAEELISAWASLFTMTLPMRPALDGGLLSEIQIGGRRWSLEIEADGQIFLTVVDLGSSDDPGVETIDRPLDDIRDALHSWVDFLTVSG